MAKVTPYYPLIPDPNNPKKRVRSNKPHKDTYLLRWKNHKDKWQSKIFHGQMKDAERLMNLLVAEVDKIVNGLKAPPEKSVKLKDTYDEYEQYLKGVKRSPRTIDRYKCSFIVFKQFFSKDIKLHQIKRSDIERFRIKRLEDCTDAGVNIDLRQLKAFFSWCYGIEYIRRSPFVGVKIGVTNGTVRFLTADEIQGLYNIIDGDTVTRDLITFYLHSGARANEILPPRFTWQNVHQNEITLIGKRKKIRKVGLNDTMKAILESRKTLEFPFPYDYNEVYRKIVRVAYRKAGILNASLHTLRKTSGSLLIQAGVDIYRVSKFLGHSSVVVTEKHYIDLLKQDYQDISASLEKQIKSDTQMIRTKHTKTYQNSVRIRAYHDDLSTIE